MGADRKKLRYNDGKGKLRNEKWSVCTCFDRCPRASASAHIEIRSNNIIFTTSDKVGQLLGNLSVTKVNGSIVNGLNRSAVLLLNRKWWKYQSLTTKHLRHTRSSVVTRQYKILCVRYKKTLKILIMPTKLPFEIVAALSINYFIFATDKDVAQSTTTKSVLSICWKIAWNKQVCCRLAYFRMFLLFFRLSSCR